MAWYDWILLIISLVIIVLCLLQGGKSEGASGAITGGGMNIFVKTKEDINHYAVFGIITTVGSNICNIIHSRHFINFRVKNSISIFMTVKYMKKTT